MRAAGAGQCSVAGRPAVTSGTDHVTEQGHTAPVPTRYRLEALSPQERNALTALATSATGPARSVQRAQALLALSSGLTASEVARQVGRSPRTIARWQARFAQEGVTAVFDAARSGAPPRLSTQDVLTICETAVAEPRSVGVELQCWSLRRLSDHLVAQGIVVRHERLRQILRAHGVSKKAEVSSQRSKDPQFVEKRDAVLRLYTQPPEDSVVVCMDQHGPVSLHGTQGQKYTATGQTPHHDAEYKRHGAIYALGALLPHVGTAFVRAFAHYNSLTVIWFLGWLLPQLPEERDIYIILDNASGSAGEQRLARTAAADLPTMSSRRRRPCQAASPPGVMPAAPQPPAMEAPWRGRRVPSCDAAPLRPSNGRAAESRPTQRAVGPEFPSAARAGPFSNGAFPMAQKGWCAVSPVFRDGGGSAGAGRPPAEGRVRPTSARRRCQRAGRLDLRGARVGRDEGAASR